MHRTLPLFDRVSERNGALRAPPSRDVRALRDSIHRQQSRMADTESDLAWKDTEGAQRAAYKVAAPSIPNRKRRLQPLAVAIMWFIAAVVLFAAGMSFLQWRSRAAAEYVFRVNQEATRKAQIEAELQQREAALREARKQALLDEKEAQRLQASAEQQRAYEAAQRTVIDEADRKAKAWAKFYRKPSVCNDATTLECANAYIRAQRAFELKYARGEL